MPRKPIQRSNEHYYHLVARTNNKEPWPISMPKTWKICCEEIRNLQLKYQVKIAALTLMNNHYHLILLTPSENIDRVMFELQRRLTQRIKKESGRINRIFGGRYKGCIIKDEYYLKNAYRYVYQNPIRAGIVTQVERYRFSSISLAFSKAFNVEDPFSESMFSSKVEKLNWLNSIYNAEDTVIIKKALSKPEFNWPKEQGTGKEKTPSI